jgi:hypothetical protein
MSDSLIKLGDFYRYIRPNRKAVESILEDLGHDLSHDEKHIDEYELPQKDIDTILEKLSPASLALRVLINYISSPEKNLNSLGVRVSNLNPRWFPQSKYEIVGHEVVHDHKWTEQIPNKKFSLIFGDFPIGLSPESYKVTPSVKELLGLNSNSINISVNKIRVLESLSFLDKEGQAFYLFEPSALGGKRGLDFQVILNDCGFYISAIFNAPEGLLLGTSVIPIIVVISRHKPKSLFVAELKDEGQAKGLAKAFIGGNNYGNLNQGMMIPVDSFYNFYRLFAEIQISKLETSYKGYKQYSFEDIIVEINTVKTGENFKEKENSIYIPGFESSPVVSKASDISIKHQNYFQVMLTSIAINDYMGSFFKSDIGKLTLSSATSGFIKKINKTDLLKVVVAIPDVSTQNKIIETQNKIAAVQSVIEKFGNEISLNPNSAVEMLDRLDDMLHVVDELTEADGIRSLIRSGETDTIEFKETLSLETKNGNKEKYLETGVLKNIAGFMNNKGGVLLVGIHDNGSVYGVDEEVSKFHKGSNDKFKLYFKNILKSRIGEENYPFVDYEIYSVDGKDVLKIWCKPIQSGMGCYLDKKEFYVRRNPGTDKLEGRELVEYTNNHFNNS